MFKNDLYQRIVDSLNLSRVGELEKTNSEWLSDELFWLECQEKDCENILSLMDSKVKQKNFCNSAVAYALGITDEAPRRAIAASESTMPDIDFDVEPEAREFLKEIYRKKYGFNNVALLGTYQTLALKQSIKDVARQLAKDISPEKVNQLNKALDRVPLDPEDFDDIEEYFLAAIEMDQGLKDFFNNHPTAREAVSALIGAAKAYGIHAAGIIIANVPLYRITGVDFSKKEGMWRTQTTMKYIENFGLIKYDILAIRTLTIIRNALEMVFERHKRVIDVNHLEADEFVLEDIRQKNTEGVFQIETDTAKSVIGGIKTEFTKSMIPQIVSLGRPGPMNQGTHIKWGRLVSGEEKVSYPHPKFEMITKETFGLIIYQEQIIKICQEIGKFSSSESVAIMKAMSKKNAEKVNSFKGAFLKGAQESGLSLEIADNTWSLMASFAEYGFNKSHAVAYAWTSYACQFLKYYYPLEFICAVLKNKKKDKLSEYYFYWQDKIKPPDINDSGIHFRIVGDKISVPLNAIQSVGDKAATAVAEKAPYRNFIDFLDRVDRKQCKKGDIRRLIMAGAFDKFAPPSASSMKDKRFHFLKLLFEHRHGTYKSSTTDEETIGKSIWDLGSESLGKEKMSKDKEHEINIVRSYEAKTSSEYFIEQIKSLGFIGFDFMSEYSESVKNLSQKKWKKGVTPLSGLDSKLNKEHVVICGLIEEVRVIKVTKEGKNKGREMAFIFVRSGKNKVKVTVFMDDYEALREAISQFQPYYPILVKGEINKFKDETGLIFHDYSILVKTQAMMSSLKAA